MKIRLLFFLVFLYCCPAIAQQYLFKQYTKEEGLSNNEVYDLIQARDGIIWAATYGGVSAFDGSSFKNYTTEDGLASDFAFSVFEDSKGRIWVGTLSKGISIIKDGKVTSPSDIDYFNYGTVTEFFEHDDGSIYIFANRGVIKYQDGMFIPIIEATEIIQDGIYVQDVVLLNDHTFAMASTRRGVILFNTLTCELDYINEDSHKINNLCFSVHLDDDGALWIGSYGALYKLKDDKKETYVPDWNDFNSNKIWRILEDNGRLYLATEGNGLLLFDKKTEQFKILDDQRGFPNKYAYSLIKDREDNFWFATYRGGLVKFRDTSFTFYDASQGLPEGAVKSVVSWNEDWAVSTENGVAIFEEGRVVDTLMKGISTGMLNVSNSKELLVSGNDTYAFQDRYSKEFVVEGAHSYVIKNDAKLVISSSSQIHFMTDGSSVTIPARKAAAIVPIGDRYLSASQFGMFQLHNNVEDSIPGLHQKYHEAFYTLDILNANTAVTANNKNLYFITLENSNFKNRIFPLDALNIRDDVTALRVAGDDLWLASKKGLSKLAVSPLLQKDSIVMQHYTNTFGFPTQAILENQIAVSKDGTVAFATKEGVGFFSEDNFVSNTQPPQLKLKNILLFAEKLDEATFLKGDKLVLPYTKNYLTFNMQAVTFTSPETVNYSYRLRGLRDSDTWSSPSQKKDIVFSYLPPGDYVFEFTADNGNGVWQPDAFTYPFTISVPFWRTIWFWSILGFTAVALGFILLSRKNLLARKRQERVTQDIINAQEEERSRVARELHDSVGQKLMMLTRKVKYLKNPEAEALAGSTLSELRSISRGLHPAVLERLGFTAALEALLEEVDEQTDTFISSEIENIDAYVSQNAGLHMYRVFQELLSNMIKHAQAPAARVEVSKEGQTLRLYLKDNGKGFNYHEKLKTTKSLGMKSILERCKIINARLEVNSQIGQGTTYILIVPI
ncbi:hypothetical protein EAX61_10510 [Dokdonia sinensis]|uniref:histidine kinase n=1 Tax=Dokdonia sinensis TaxID=2479847 RepID=A0A3M0FZ79_9FLAO|nr:sensor histidine kinase [Dokdonia sinensis]RMB58041.1 hypothetical protein EAX61_10510 [Dokdonia sinensis]